MITLWEWASCPECQSGVHRLCMGGLSTHCVGCELGKMEIELNYAAGRHFAATFGRGLQDLILMADAKRRQN